MPLHVHLCYLYSLLGFHQKCKTKYKTLYEKKGLDVQTKSILENNILAEKSKEFSDQPSKNTLQDSLKKMEKLLVIFHHYYFVLDTIFYIYSNYIFILKVHNIIISR